MSCVDNKMHLNNPFHLLVVAEASVIVISHSLSQGSPISLIAGENSSDVSVPMIVS